jgi:REP element-mobilizing transposase RayT
MARPLRIQFPGGLYHVTARGNGRQALFADDTDRERFLIVLTRVVARYRLLCHAHCLMGNHYHLLLETPDANLSSAMRQLNGVYSQAFNRRHERPGHVLEGRFHAQVVDKDAYLREVCRYIVLNPVRAGLVAHPREWPWSSYRATAGDVPAPPFLTVDWVLSLGEKPERADAERSYRRFVDAGLDEPTASLEPMGSRVFVGNAGALGPVRERIGDALRVLEVPRAQRFFLRPDLASLFAMGKSQDDRDARCVLAVREHGYTMSAVARYLGVHYSTVSRALERGEIQSSKPRMLDCKT